MLKFLLLSLGPYIIFMMYYLCGMCNIEKLTPTHNFIFTLLGVISVINTIGFFIFYKF